MEPPSAYEHPLFAERRKAKARGKAARGFVHRNLRGEGITGLGADLPVSHHRKSPDAFEFRRGAFWVSPREQPLAHYGPHHFKYKLKRPVRVFEWGTTQRQLDKDWKEFWNMIERYGNYGGEKARHAEHIRHAAQNLAIWSDWDTDWEAYGNGPPPTFEAWDSNVYQDKEFVDLIWAVFQKQQPPLDGWVRNLSMDKKAPHVEYLFFDPGDVLELDKSEEPPAAPAPAGPLAEAAAPAPVQPAVEPEVIDVEEFAREDEKRKRRAHNDENARKRARGEEAETDWEDD